MNRIGNKEVANEVCAASLNRSPAWIYFSDCAAYTEGVQDTYTDSQPKDFNLTHVRGFVCVNGSIARGIRLNRQRAVYSQLYLQTNPDKQKSV